MAVRVRSSSVPSPRRAVPAARPILNRAIQEHLARELKLLLGAPDERPLPPALSKLIARLREALGAQARPVEPWFQDGIMEALPSLRAFAISLTGNVDRADDLVQDTVLKALDKRDTFREGTNLVAWLFTILRNHFYTEHRKRSREVEDVDGIYAERLRTSPDQLDKIHVRELQAALARLSVEQREALILVGAEGLPYEAAAQICGCKVGTIKSRVNRARARVAELMGYTDGDLAADQVMQAALCEPTPRSSSV